MGVKGTATKTLDVPQLEKTVFECNLFLRNANEEAANISAEIRALKEEGIDKLTGGQGDLIVGTIKSVEQGVNTLSVNLQKISKSLNEKLAKTLEAYKDKNNIADAQDKAARAAANAGLKKQ